MNYRHLFHAGNFADVFKHSILVLLIESLVQKDRGLFYIDTHAGSGLYDLQAHAAQKTQEFAAGINKVYAAPHPPAVLEKYLGCIRVLNQAHCSATHPLPRYYPGSPYIIKHFLRAQDQLLLTELHREEYLTLKRNFKPFPDVRLYSMDGYQSLKAFLPPPLRRGLIIIDPPFEQPNEFIDIISALKNALKRFATGTYLVWYPIKDPKKVTVFLKKLQAIAALPLLTAEINLLPTNHALKLTSCGVAIINPPWQLASQLKSYLPWLSKTLTNAQGQWQVTSF